MDIAGAQAHFGALGRLSRIDVRLAPGAQREAVLRELALPPGVRAAAPEEAAQRLSNVSRAYRVNLTRAGAGGAVHRRVPRVLGALAVGARSASRSSRCSACSA